MCVDRRGVERSRDQLTGLSRQQTSCLDIKQRDGWRVCTVLKGFEMQWLTGDGTFKVFTYLSAQIKLWQDGGERNKLLLT